MAVTTVSDLLLSYTKSDVKHVLKLSQFTVGEVYPSFPLFPSSNYIAQEVMCNGTEYSFRQCNYNPPTSPECFVGSRSAAVVCRQGYTAW